MARSPLRELSVSFSAVPWLLTAWLGWREEVLIVQGCRLTSQAPINVYSLPKLYKTPDTQRKRKKVLDRRTERQIASQMGRRMEWKQTDKQTEGWKDRHRHTDRQPGTQPVRW